MRHGSHHTPHVKTLDADAGRVIHRKRVIVYAGSGRAAGYIGCRAASVVAVA